MYKEKYRALIEEVCQKAHLGDPAEKLESLNIGMAGAHFQITHEEKLAPSTLLLYVKFGTPPVDASEAAMLRLLETNFLMAGGGNNPSFAMDVETGAIVLIVSFPLETVTADALLHTMSHYAVVVAQWKNHYFMSEIERETGKLMAGSARSSTDGSTAARLARRH